MKLWCSERFYCDCRDSLVRQLEQRMKDMVVWDDLVVYFTDCMGSKIMEHIEKEMLEGRIEYHPVYYAMKNSFWGRTKGAPIGIMFTADEFFKLNRLVREVFLKSSA